MASVAEHYCRELFKALEYFATWFPSSRVSLGDLGSISDDYEFRRAGDLSDFDIAFVPDAPLPAHGPISHRSEGSMSIVVQAEADVQKIPEVPAGKAGLSIEFSRERAVVFAAPSSNISRIKSDLALKKAILARQDDLKEIFDAGMVVVTEVVTADSATALISESKDSKYVVSAEADFKAGVVSIGDATLGITSRFEKDVRTELMASTNVTPLFRGLKLTRDGWGRAKAETRDALGDSDIEAMFVDLTPETARL